MSAEVSPTDDPILVYRQKFIDAVKAGDIDTALTFCVDDVVVMSPNDSTVYGKLEWKEWLEEYFQYFRFVVFNEPERSVVVNGDFATEHTSYMIAIVPVGGTTRIRDDGRFLTIWKRQPDGAWKVWQMIWNSSKPIGIGTNRYMWRVTHKKARSKR